MADMQSIRHSARFKDITGCRFGRLLAVSFSHTKGSAYWNCICDCGRQSVVQGSALRSGIVVSCGCYRKEAAARAVRKHGHAANYSRTPEYRCWSEMKQRCCNPDAAGYSYYGGRGIRVCDEWLTDFNMFLASMGPMPKPGMSLDRIDSNGNYEPGNVRWATRWEQSRNRRSNVNITFDGETMCLADWAKRVGVRTCTMIYRIRNWTVERALTEASNTKHRRK